MITAETFLNTYAQMRSYEKSAENAKKQYKTYKQRSWKKLQEQFEIQANRLRTTLDSHVVTHEVRKEAHNG